MAIHKTPRRTKVMREVPWRLVELNESIHTVLYLHNDRALYRESDEAMLRAAQLAERWAKEVRALVTQPANT